MIKMSEFYIFPRIKSILAGYRSYGRFADGLGLMWLGYMVTIIKPINQR